MSEAGVAEVEQDETEGPEIIRAKWIMDDATTLHEAAGMLRAEADRLEQLHEDGWTAGSARSRTTTASSCRPRRHGRRRAMGYQTEF